MKNNFVKKNMDKLHKPSVHKDKRYFDTEDAKIAAEEWEDFQWYENQLDSSEDSDKLDDIGCSSIGIGE